MAQHSLDHKHGGESTVYILGKIIDFQGSGTEAQFFKRVNHSKFSNTPSSLLTVASSSPSDATLSRAFKLIIYV